MIKKIDNLDRNSNNEVDFIEILKTLFEGKGIILITTILFTLAGSLYLNSLPIQPYQASISFTSASENQIRHLNNILKPVKHNFNQKEVLEFEELNLLYFNDFLYQLQQKQNQTNIFINGGYISQFNSMNEPISNKEMYAKNILQSLSFTLVQNELTSFPSYQISLQGYNPPDLQKFLASLLKTTEITLIDSIRKDFLLKIKYKKEDLIFQRLFLINKILLDRKYQIEQIKRTKFANKMQLTNQIIIEENTIKLNADYEISTLNEAAELATELEVMDNNFTTIIGSQNNLLAEINSKSGEKPSDEHNLDWFLFGEKALLKKIEIMQNRSKNSPINSKILSLKKQIMEIDNDPYFDQLLELKDDQLSNVPLYEDIKIIDKMLIELENMVNRSKDHDFRLVRVTDDSILSDLSTNNTTKIISLSIFLGFFLSILIVLIKDAIIKRTDSIS